jgi:short-subunit dehydrogenase
VVTGATSGLGKSIALRLARDGATVLVVGRDKERGAQTVDEIVHAGGTARFIAADLDDPAGIVQLAEQAGPIDVLVNNAGQSIWGATDDFAVADFDSMFASNVRAPFLLVAAFAPGMASRGTGSIINIGSMAGSIGLPSGAAYGATKAALASLTGHGRPSTAHVASASTPWPQDRPTPGPKDASATTPWARRPR